MNKQKAIDIADKLGKEVKYPGPYGCKCQNVKAHILGDGCDEYNSKYYDSMTEEKSDD